MPRPDDASPNSGPLRVDLPELRGYAGVLDDVSRDLGGCEGLANSYCYDAEFGKIVDDFTDDYAVLLPQLKDLLAENETVMRQYAVAVDRTAADYVRTDDGVSSRFNGDGISTGRGTAKFPLTSVGSASPSASEGELPEVSFGFAFDKLAWALETFVGWDIRGAVTDWIAGDVVGLSTQAHCWEIIGGRMSITQTNLSEAATRVNRTWDGRASSQQIISMYRWDTAMSEQAQGFKDLGESLRSLAKEAVHVAQLVVDCVRLAVDLILSAWALQYIPVYGQVKFIKKAIQAYKIANKAVAYLKMILAAIRATKSLVIVMIDSFTPTMLPGKPISV